ncbi:probable WRKY transcription factor 27 [Zingiber officinale]|uniref:WRKY domain-containing protein n=1 Tax=Zingiber officinale TaxID=94328 RepID=A0A8J5FJS5_ZINOF|nr:probable WRKY transcription factor 27 [Zingiber officinale]KAG6489712.1 hypothetical protein ZIOFF_050988 [Zingiber officinale]
MCDFFWPRMEGYRGDLTDIVISGSRSHGELQPVATDDPISFPSSRSPNNNNNNFGGGDELNFAMVRPCDDLLRVLQISPGGSDLPGVPRPSLPVLGGVEMEISSTNTQGIKRRKGQSKRVVCIPAPVVPAAATGRTSGEVVPCDLWAWRKYGQKPIKGSPYPRGYYKCSSSKGCSARKQVERSRTNPNMLVITYTSEHNHPWPTQRNALAGLTRCHPPKNPKSPPLWKEEPTERVKDGSLLRVQETEEEDDLDLITMMSQNFATDGNSEEEEEKEKSGVEGLMGMFNWARST